MYIKAVSQSRSDRAQQAGFSLIEILITMLIFGTITAGLLVVFDNSSRLARSQTQLAMLQQNQRVGHSELVRYVKMAGLGGLPLSLINLEPDQLTDASLKYKEPGMFPRGFAIEVINNIEENRRIDSLDAGGGGSLDALLEGSDVLIVRGVFSTPIYYVATPSLAISSAAGCNPTTSGDICLTDSGKKVEGTLIIPGKVRVVDVANQDLTQDLLPLSQRLQSSFTAAIPEAFILRDVLNPNAYVIVALDLARITDISELALNPCTIFGLAAGDPANPECIDIPVKLDRNVELGKNYADLMLGTSLIAGSGLTSEPAAPPAKRIEVPGNISSIGLLEEYRFYISDEPADYRRILKRARFLPGTDTEVETIVVADNVVDLQIAIGADTDTEGVGLGQVTDAGTADDEVLFNHPGDYSGPPEGPTYADTPISAVGEAKVWYNPTVQFHYLRINTLVQSEQRDQRYQAAELVAIEDYLRTDYNEIEERQLQRRWLQTVVELRNLQ
jgi:prepilin-type N-terminal cleavage/methylation domain-containing protein